MLEKLRCRATDSLTLLYLGAGVGSQDARAFSLMASDLREVTSLVGFSLPVYEMRLWVGLDVLWILFLPDSSDVAVHFLLSMAKWPCYRTVECYSH